MLNKIRVWLVACFVIRHSVKKKVGMLFLINLKKASSHQSLNQTNEHPCRCEAPCEYLYFYECDLLCCCCQL